MIELSPERLEKYVLLSLTDSTAPQTIYEECGNDEEMLLAVAGYILVNQNRAGFLKEHPEREKKEAVCNLLRFRCHCRDKNFTWTDENKRRFFRINNAFVDSCEKAWAEALATAEALEERIKQQDRFLNDYEIDIKIDAYPYPALDDEEGFEEFDAYFCEFYELPRISSISHSSYKDDDRTRLFIDKTTNWNIEYFGDEFENDYICYAIHRLIDTGIWSFEDILSIKQIWADVNVAHQNCFNLGGFV